MTDRRTHGNWTVRVGSSLALAAVLASNVYLIWSMLGVQRDITANGVITERLERTIMQTITTEVTDTQGRTHVIATTRNTGETVSDWLARHDEACVAAAAL